MAYELRNKQKEKGTKSVSGLPADTAHNDKRPNPFAPTPHGQNEMHEAVNPGNSKNADGDRGAAHPIVDSPPERSAPETSDLSQASKLEAFFESSTQKFEAMIERAVKSLVDKLKSVEELLGSSLEMERKRVNDLQEKQQSLEKKVKDLEMEVTKLRAEADKSEIAANKSERFSRNNIRIVGIDEPPKRPQHLDQLVNGPQAAAGPQPDKREDCIVIVEEKLRVHFGIQSKVERAHRDGKRVEGRPRHIIVKLLSYRDKVEVMKKARDVLKNERFFVIDDLTSADLQEKRKWSKQVQALYAAGTKMRFYAGKWRVRGGEAFDFEKTARVENSDP